MTDERKVDADTPDVPDATQEADTPDAPEAQEKAETVHLSDPSEEAEPTGSSAEGETGGDSPDEKGRMARLLVGPKWMIAAAATVVVVLLALGPLQAPLAQLGGFLNDDPVASGAASDDPAGYGWFVTLDGTGSTDPDGDPLTLSWSQTSGTPVALTNAANGVDTFTAPAADDTLCFDVQADDGNGGSDTDSVCVVVDGTVSDAPILDVTLVPTTVNEADRVALTVVVTDRDPGDTFQFSWSQTSGPAAILEDAGGTPYSAPSSSTDAFFDAPALLNPTTTDDVEFRLDVTDSFANSASDSVTITVNNVLSPPSPSIAFTPSTPNVGESVTFQDTSTDRGGQILTRAWDFQDSITRTNGVERYTFSGPGNHNVCIDITDDDGDTARGCTVVPVGNQGPAIDIQYEVPVLVFRSTSFEAVLPENTLPREYDWVIDGALYDDVAATQSHIFDTSGAKNVQLAVTFMDGTQSLATVSVTVHDAPRNTGGSNGGGGAIDADGDGIANADDNCETIFNPDQADKDNDGKGDVCDDVDSTPPDDGSSGAGNDSGSDSDSGGADGSGDEAGGDDDAGLTGDSGETGSDDAGVGDNAGDTNNAGDSDLDGGGQDDAAAAGDDTSTAVDGEGGDADAGDSKGRSSSSGLLWVILGAVAIAAVLLVSLMLWRRGHHE